LANQNDYSDVGPPGIAAADAAGSSTVTTSPPAGGASAETAPPCTLATAAIGTLVIFIVMQVLGSFSYFDFLKPYLFTSHLDAWQNLFQGTIDWGPLEKGLLAFFAYIVVSTVAAWYVFRRKDVLV